MKKLLSILIFLSLPGFLSAQKRGDRSSEGYNNSPVKFSKIDTLDSQMELECLYAFTEIDDELKRSRNHTLIVQVGKGTTMQQDLNNYLQDSICESRKYDMTWAQWRDLVSEHRDTYHKFLIRSSGRYREHTNFALDFYEYTDSNLHFNWTILEDTMTVCGYLCRKAVVPFRGRTWTVWYTDLIPIDAGPWKLHGLPGMILKATDNGALHDFEAIALRQPHRKHITENRSSGLSKVTRKRFSELEYDYVININKYAEAFGIATGNKGKSSRLFYSPLELE